MYKAIKLLLRVEMKKIEENISDAFKNEAEVVFDTSDTKLFERAATTASNQQGSKDLIALGMASIWIVFVSLFMKILHPIFTRMTPTPRINKQHTNTTNQGIK